MAIDFGFLIRGFFMKGRCLPVVALLIALVLCSSLVAARSSDEGIRLFNEGQALQGKARTNEDLQGAIQKYQKALVIFEQLGFKQGIGAVTNNLGAIYKDWGQFSKAADCYQRALTIAQETRDRRGEAGALNNLGEIYWRWAQYDKGVEYSKKSLAIFQEIKDREHESLALIGLGLMHSAQGQYGEAKEYFEKALEIYRDIKDHRGESNVLTNLGSIYSNLGQYEKAVEYYDQAFAIAKGLKDRRAEAEALNGLGDTYWRLGQNERAADYCKKSLAIFVELKNPSGEGDVLHNLGNIYGDLGQYDSAVDYYEKCLAIMKRLKDLRGESYTLNDLGVVYKDWGQYEKAAQHYRKSLEICREIKNPSGEVTALNNLGVIYKGWGKYDKAVEYYEQSMNLAKQLKQPQGEAAAMNNLGGVYRLWGQYEKTSEYCRKSLAIRRELKDLRGEGEALNNLGAVYSDRGQNEKAMDYFQKAIKIAKELKDRMAEGKGIINVGRIFQHRGELGKALEYYQRGFSICSEIKIPVIESKGLIAEILMETGDLSQAEPLLKEVNSDELWGRFYLLRADYSRANQCYWKILKLAEATRDVNDRFTACQGIATAYEGLNEKGAAKEYYEDAVRCSEQVRSSLPPSEREMFFDVTVNGFSRTAPYEGLARLQIKMDKPLEAFKTTEYTRARVFSETLSRTSEGKSLDVPNEIIAQDSSMNNELAALRKNLHDAYKKNNMLTIQSMDTQVKERERQFFSHVKMLRDNYPIFAATKYPQPMDLSQTALTDNEWVLAYHITDSGLIIYLTKGKKLIKGLFKPIPRKEVDELVRNFRKPMEVASGETVAQKLAKFDFASGKKLSDLLLSDILSDLPQNAPVIIVPDGSLGVVPFEMLVLNDGGKTVTENKKTQTSGTEFFGDRNPISYYQSITALTLARTLGKHQKSGEKTLAMVDPVFSAEDPRLTKFAKQERDKLLANLPNDLTMSIQTESGLTFPRLALTSELGESLKKSDPQKTDLYEGLNAKKSSLLNKDLTSYKSLVFGTHGYFGKDLPGIQEPVLVMSLLDQPKGQDGFLRLSEVMGLKLNCDIAALTACQTGLGRHISGEGTMGMGRAFQYAGAKSVLMSLWSVSETASVDLVESFFKHLKEGKSKLKALKLAREEIRKAGYDHPFYWAPFILMGEVE
jgi:tetratricopeptide (TPR) repeat protein